METKDLKIVYKNIDELKEWDKNPRGITADDFERLKSQIKRFGLYKPFLVNEAGIVLGGNMRHKACKALGITRVPVSVVQAPTEKEMLEYALSDNDRAGYYDDVALSEIVFAHKDEIVLNDYHVDLGHSLSLDDMLESVSGAGQQKEKQEDPAPFDGFVIVMRVPNDKFTAFKTDLDALCDKHAVKADIS